MNQTAHKDDLPQAIPALEVKLFGKYLIEASAGTGKTWTLTGIILRLLIEANRTPEQIIATTFTKAAAAEMRQRIQERLLDFYKLVQWLQKLQEDPDNRAILSPQYPIDSDRESKDDLPTLTDDQKIARHDCLKNQAEFLQMQDLIADPINLHLLDYLLDNLHKRSLESALLRVRFTLTNLDKLFVGTLDSLAQKWLNEYSVETGYQHDTQIVTDQSALIDDLVHDAIRQHHNRLYFEDPQLYHWLEQSGRLTQAEDHAESLKQALSFLDTPIDPVVISNFDRAGYQALLDSITERDFEAIVPYFSSDFCEKVGMKKNSTFFKLAPSLSDLLAGIGQKIQQHGSVFFSVLEEDEKKLFGAIAKAFEGSIFKKGYEDEEMRFRQLPLIIKLKKINDQHQAFTDYLDSIKCQFNRDLVESVRQKLPLVLAEQNQTTFALQMQRLNQALTGDQGKTLARHLAHKYPIALIDEAQDMNADQAQLIKTLYLTQNLPNGFLLLVGDPKQAIYGFRGGDVENYNQMKRWFATDHQKTLTTNRRSNKALIDALNHWFGAATNDPVRSELGAQIHYHAITAHREQSELVYQEIWQNDANADPNFDSNSDSNGTQNPPTFLPQFLPNKPISILHKEYNGNKFSQEDNLIYQVAKHIQYTLASPSQLNQRPLETKDIAVLVRTRSVLNQVEKELNKLGIATQKATDESVLQTRMAIEIIALLEALYHANKETYLNRVLMGEFYGAPKPLMNQLLHDYNALKKNDPSHTPKNSTENTYLKIQQYFYQLNLAWQKQGLIIPLQKLLNDATLYQYLAHYQPQNHQPQNPTYLSYHNVWEYLADKQDGERNLIDLMHLLEILEQKSQHLGQKQLIDWLKTNLDRPEEKEEYALRPLNRKTGVQLMTIHKSKGLEFPIVYVLGMDKDPTANLNRLGTKPNLYLYTPNDPNTDPSQNAPESQNPRRFSGVSYAQINQKNTPDYFKNIHKNQLISEYKRLAYVAFTRASEQLFITIEETAQNRGTRPLQTWLNFENNQFSRPAHLTHHIDWQEIENLHTIPSMPSTTSGSSTTQTPTQTQLNESPIAYQDFATLMPKTHFQGFGKTSFTALSAQLDSQSHQIRRESLVIDEQGGYDEVSDLSFETDNPDTDQLATHNIRFWFEKGKSTGVFLHKLLEKIDFVDQKSWSNTINNLVREQNLPIFYADHSQQTRQNRAIFSDLANQTDHASANNNANNANNAHNALKTWIYDILSTPLIASGKALRDIAPNKRVAELSFSLGLGMDFCVEKINQVFQHYLEADKQIFLSPHQPNYLYRYLNGEIDLVYEEAGRYFIVDYKSNFLGNDFKFYRSENLAQIMSQTGYWLQAVIYQVALHRFLSLKMPNYLGNEADYLGGVEYVFLRGIPEKLGQAEQNQSTIGRIYWQIPIDLIKAMDALFYGDLWTLQAS